MGSPEGKSCYWDEHEIQREGGDALPMPNWEWAEWVNDWVVYAESGCLYKLSVKSSGKLSEPELLHDFNGYHFEARQAPY